MNLLPGEDLATSALPEVALWITIYEELDSVLRMVLSRASGDAGSAADLRHNLAFVDARLALWRERHQALAGVTIDLDDRSLTFGGRYLKLTRRESKLLDFLIRNPGRHFTTRQLTALAWQNARLSDAQVRTYMMRLRRKLREVGLDDLITILRNRGYAVELPEPSAQLDAIGAAP